jgi:hypothetical protein
MNDDIEQDQQQDEVQEPAPAVAAAVEDAPPQPTDEAPDDRIVSAQQKDPRRRMRELLTIPDSQRSDAEWDELIALEISLAPGNRIAAPNPNNPGQRPDKNRKPEMGRRPDQGQPRPDQPGRTDPKTGMRPGKRFFKKPKRPGGGPQGGPQSGPGGAPPKV